MYQVNIEVVVKVDINHYVHESYGLILVEGGNEIEGGKKPFMRADKKGFRKNFKK